MSITWSDDAILLSARPHGESALVLQLLTRERGRHAGLVQGGQGRKSRATFQPGTRLRVVWRARLAEHLGNVTAESLGSTLGGILDSPGPLAALASTLALAERALPEREPHAACYEGLLALLDALAGEHWGEATVLWELQLLAELGFGLDFSACAATGRNDQLVWVSPKSGRAVSASAGEPYRERLLPLPPFLLGQSAGGPEEVRQGLALTGHFLEQGVFLTQHQPLPPARQRLYARFATAPLPEAAAANDAKPEEEAP